MQSRWNDADAARAVAARPNGVSELLAVRTYSARLLGADASLVLHGGGNTSVKATATTPFGEMIDVLHVKGSGWDLATIEPPGHPAVRMSTCKRLLELPSMTDEQMVNELRLALLDASAPTPSVETLLHAALPARFIDHTHADAVLALVDQSNARALVERTFGAEALFVPYVMPGFGLARACKEAWNACAGTPSIMILERHGIFTFGDSAKESYERMIEAVTRAERKPLAAVAFTRIDPVATVATLRGALARAANEPAEQGPIVALRTSDRVLSFLARSNVDDLVARGCATPDHVIRIKPWPLVVGPNDDLDRAIAGYRARYDAYFADAARAKNVERTKLDPWPRIVLARGVGICAVGRTKKDAEIAADVYEHTIDVIERAETIGSYSPVGLSDLFDVEYWSLEQAKLKKATPLPMSGRVAVVTGAASGIGRATAETFERLGAHVVSCDRTPMPERRYAIACDVTRNDDVERAFDHAVTTFGGVDVVVSNAGSATEGKLEDEAGADALRSSLELNLHAHVNVARAAVARMRLGRRGGALLFNASKSAFNQGPGFGPYAVAKAALVALMRQYAVDLAKDGIRSNALNADRIRTNLFGEGMAEARAKARGLTVDDYFRANLLAREVTANDVADAFAWLACAKATTGCVVTVDGGNSAAFPR
jgi:rhamnose utilization protein RhaD (predicted bifunctional aldolase and dehydrogenase)/NAD(P)-dependent dehydrogenase (short-subunit alcohol dehydrogenase family)